MRRSQVLLFVSSAVLCSAAALPQQQTEELAEQRYKNIITMKGMKASEVMPAMQFMSASLKVDCTFCHEADWSKDTKDAKRVTRDMMVMQKDINDKNFGGHLEVTCATCHSGRAHPLNVSPAEGADLRMRRDNKVSPEKVLAAYAKAVGPNPGKVAAGIRLEGVTTNRGEKGTAKAVYAGNKYQIVMVGPKATVKQGFNGTDAWFAIPGRVEVIPPDHSAVYINERRVFFGPNTLPKMSTMAGGTATIRGRAQSAVTAYLQDDEKTRVSFYFDDKTGLLTRAAFYYSTVIGTIAQINDYSNYQKVNGVQVPMTIESHAADKDFIFKVKSAKVDPKIDPTVFDPSR
jgi:hypothetical protein